MKTLALILLTFLIIGGCGGKKYVPPVKPVPVCADDEYRNPKDMYQCIKVTQCIEYPNLTADDRETLVNPQPKRQIRGREILAWWKAVDTAVDNGSIDPVMGKCLRDQLPDIIIVDFLDCGTRNPEDLISGEVNRFSGCANDGFIMVEHLGETLLVHEFIHLLQYLVLGKRGHPCQFFFPDPNNEGKFDVIGFQGGEEFLCPI